MNSEDIKGIEANVPKLKVENIEKDNTSKAEYFSPIWSTDRMEYNELYRLENHPNLNPHPSEKLKMHQPKLKFKHNSKGRRSRTNKKKNPKAKIL